MQEQLEKRVTELETEYRAGQEMLADLEAKRADLHQTLAPHQRGHPGAEGNTGGGPRLGG